MAALGTTTQAPRYGLRLTDTTHDPRRGGTMLLAVPDFAAATSIHGTLNLFAYYLRGVFDIEHVRLTFEPRGEHEHDVKLSVDLVQGWPGMSAWGLPLRAPG